MKILRNIALVLVTTAFMSLAQIPSKASNECTDQCAQSLQNCTADAEYNEEICEEYAEISQAECEDLCDSIYITWQGCWLWCDSNNEENIDNCMNREFAANDSCQQTFDVCANNCPPD